MENAKNSYIRTFGRIHGKKLSARQQWLLDNLLPTLIPTQTDAAGAVLEIGFGAGEHILHLAKNHQSLQIIGAEPFINGVASLLSQMADDENKVKPEYQNIRIWPDDVRKLFNLNSKLSTLNSVNLCFAKIYILHPDPWPKARHEKRRLLSAEFLNELAERLAPGGQIIIATDHLDYFDWILEQTKKSRLLTLNSKLLKSNSLYEFDFTTPPESGLDTRYKKKDMFGANTCRYLVLGM